MAPESPYRLLVTLQNRGAGVERIELVQRTVTGRFRFQDLEQASGYLGHLALSDEPEGKGCRVNVVGPGTPAAAAKAQSPGAGDGLRAGDVIRRIDSSTVRDTIDWDRLLADTKPGQTVQIAVARTAGAESTQGTVADRHPDVPTAEPRAPGNPAAFGTAGAAVLSVDAGKHRGCVRPAGRGGNRQAAQVAGQQLAGPHAGRRRQPAPESNSSSC